MTRLANRACLALWCGNNEIEQMASEITTTLSAERPTRKSSTISCRRRSRATTAQTRYWPSSPHNPEGYTKGPNNEKRGRLPLLGCLACQATGEALRGNGLSLLLGIRHAVVQFARSGGNVLPAGGI